MNTVSCPPPGYPGNRQALRKSTPRSPGVRGTRLLARQQARTRNALALAIAANLWLLPVAAAPRQLTDSQYIGPGQSLTLGKGDSLDYTGPRVAMTVTGANAVVIGRGASFRFGGAKMDVAGGLRALAGGRIELEQGTVTSNQSDRAVYDTLLVEGQDAAGVASKIRVSGVEFLPGANQSGFGAFEARDGGSLHFNDGRITAGKRNAFFGLFSISGAGSEIRVSRTTIALTGNSGLGVAEQGSLTLQSMQLASTDGHLNMLISGAGSKVIATDSTLRNARFDIMGGAQADITQLAVTNETQPVFHLEGGSELSRATVSKGKYAATGSFVVELDHDSRFVAGDARIVGTDVRAALYSGSSSAELVLDKTAVQTAGQDGAHGVDMLGGSATLDNSTVDTQGNAAFGLRGMQGSETQQTLLVLRDSQVQIQGSGGGALYVDGDKVSASIERSQLGTNKAAAHGLVQVDRAQLSVSESQVAVSGAGASAYLSQRTRSSRADAGSQGGQGGSGSQASQPGNRAVVIGSNLSARGGPTLHFQGDQHQLDLRESRVLSGESESKPGWLMQVSDMPLVDGTTLATGQVTVAAADTELFGDVRVDSGSAVVRLQLQGNSRLQGALLGNGGRQVSELRLRDDSAWEISAASSVGWLSHQGVVQFAAPTAANGFKRLEVVNTYDTDGGTLVLNTRLGGDDSATDLLHVQGDAGGSGMVRVVNAQGAGGLTSEGIRVIQVDGGSTAELSLAGRVVAGAHEYALFQGRPGASDDGHWYLRSNQAKPPAPEPPDSPTTPDNPGTPGSPGSPSTPGSGSNPAAPGAPSAPLWRPEVAAYGIGQWAALSLFAHSLHDRLGEPVFAERQRDGQGRHAWLRSQRQQHDGRTADGQVAVSSDQSLLHAGAELTRWEHGDHRLHLGLMAGVGQAQGHVGSMLTGYRAKSELRGQAVGVYGSWFAHAGRPGGLYLDGWLQHGRFRHRTIGQGLAPAHYASRSWTASLEAGYAWAWHLTTRAHWMLEPQAQLVYVQHGADRVREANGTGIDASAGAGVDSRLGLRLYAQSLDQQTMRVQPYLGMHREWYSARRGVRFNDVALTHGMPRRVDTVQAGADAELGGGWTVRGFVTLRRGDGRYREVAGQVGLGYRW